MPADGGLAHGFDHNYEYRITGSFTARKVYDPNADMELPVFSPGSYEVMNRTPGFLFSPNDRYSPKYIPAPGGLPHHASPTVARPGPGGRQGQKPSLPRSLRHPCLTAKFLNTFVILILR